MSAFQSFNSFKEQAVSTCPQLAIVLGSGLESLSHGLEVLISVAYSQIPGLPSPTVPGHEGRLALCKWRDKGVLVFRGRLHFYEGHCWDAVTRPIQIALALGARILLATNAAGGISPNLNPGSFMAIRDHLDWTQPFSKPTDSRPCTCSHSPYSSRLLKAIQLAASTLKFDLQTGVYAAVTGPTYETPAEIRAMRYLGADVVGMSTLREIKLAHDLGIECAAISCITNRAAGLDQGAAISHQEVLNKAMENSRRLTALIESFIQIIA
jgi:purine-nucleoside phosphorylase